MTLSSEFHWCHLSRQVNGGCSIPFELCFSGCQKQLLGIGVSCLLWTLSLVLLPSLLLARAHQWPLSLWTSCSSSPGPFGRCSGFRPSPLLSHWAVPAWAPAHLTTTSLNWYSIYVDFGSLSLALLNQLLSWPLILLGFLHLALVITLLSLPTPWFRPSQRQPRGRAQSEKQELRLRLLLICALTLCWLLVPVCLQQELSVGQTESGERGLQDSGQKLFLQEGQGVQTGQSKSVRCLACTRAFSSNSGYQLGRVLQAGWTSSGFRQPITLVPLRDGGEGILLGSRHSFARFIAVMALEALSLEEVKLFDTGQYYVLEWLDPEEEDGRKECVAIVIMKRSNGLLLAIPTGFLPEEVLAVGAEDEDSMVGRSSVMTVAGVLLEEGAVNPIGAQLQTLVVDMDVAVLMHLREMEDVEPIMQGFSEDDPYELLAKALAWLESLEGLGEKLGPLWYTPAQTEESTEEARVNRAGFCKGKAKSSASRWGYSYRRAKREGKEAYNSFTVGLTSGGVADPADPDKSASVGVSEAAEHGGQAGEAEQCGLYVVSAFGRSGFSSEPSRLGKGDPQAPEGEGCSTVVTSNLGNSSCGCEGAGGDQGRPDSWRRCGKGHAGPERCLNQPSGSLGRGCFKEGQLRVPEELWEGFGSKPS